MAKFCTITKVFLLTLLLSLSFLRYAFNIALITEVETEMEIISFLGRSSYTNMTDLTGNRGEFINQESNYSLLKNKLFGIKNIFWESTIRGLNQFLTF